MTATAEREARPGLMKGVLFIVLIGLIVVAMTAFALSQRKDGGAVVATGEAAPMPVRTVTVELSDMLSVNEAFAGLAEARRSSALGFERGGRIDRIAVDVGDRVKAGETLAQLDVRALQAQLAAARAQTAEAQSARDLAFATVERLRPLAVNDLTPRQRLDEAEAALKQAEARIAASEASANLVGVQIALSRITAPYDGVVTARMADEGAIAGPGVPLIQIVEDGAVEFRFGLPANVAETLELNATYPVETPGGEVQATLKAVTGVVSASGRTVDVVFETEALAAVRSGDVVRIRFPRQIDERGFWLPISALSEASRGLWSVLAVERDDAGREVVRPRLIEVVHTEGERVYVRGPVRQGDRIVVEGLQRLVPGMRVNASASVAGLGGQD